LPNFPFDFFLLLLFDFVDEELDEEVVSSSKTKVGDLEVPVLVDGDFSIHSREK
jgi:hypothetical protein